MNDFGTRNQESVDTRQAAEAVIKRVYQAVNQLCVNPGDVRQRLLSAIRTLLPLQESEFPEELRKDFSWILSQSTKYKSDNPEFRGKIEETMRRIRKSTGQKIAERIFYIYSRLQEIRGFPLLDYRHPRE